MQHKVKLLTCCMSKKIPLPCVRMALSPEQQAGKENRQPSFTFDLSDKVMESLGVRLLLVPVCNSLYSGTKQNVSFPVFYCNSNKSILSFPLEGHVTTYGQHILLRYRYRYTYVVQHHFSPEIKKNTKINKRIQNIMNT